MTYLLDADWSIDYLAGRQHAQALYPTLEQAGMAMSVVTRIELWTGVDGSQNPQQAARELARFLQVVTVIPLNRRVEREVVRLRHELLSRNLPIKHRAYDLIVAATALAYDLTVVTSNTRDYQDIPDLKRLNPRQQ